MSDSLELLTVVVPTHDRPGDLKGLLGFLKLQAPTLRLRVLDSSRPETTAINSAMCRGLPGRPVEHLFFGFPEYSQIEKYIVGTRDIETPYIAFCADDDVILIDSVRRCVEHLVNHPATIAAHGRYFNFSTDRVLLSLEYSLGVEGDTAARRVVALFRNYEPNFYAVQRTSVFKKAMAVTLSLETAAFRELAMAGVLAAEGSVARLSCLHYGRRNGPQSAFENWHPIQVLRNCPESIFEDHKRLIDSIWSTMEEPRPASRSAFETALWCALFEYMATICTHANVDSLLTSLEQVEDDQTATRRFVGVSQNSRTASSVVRGPAAAVWHRWMNRFELSEADLISPPDSARPVAARIAAWVRWTAASFGAIGAEPLTSENGWRINLSMLSNMPLDDIRTIARLLRIVEDFEISATENRTNSTL